MFANINEAAVIKQAAILRNICDKQYTPETTWMLKHKAQGTRFSGAALFADSPRNTLLYKLHETRATCAGMALVEVFRNSTPNIMAEVEYVLILVPSETDPSAYERVGMATVNQYFEMGGRRHEKSASPFRGGGILRTIDIV